MQPEYLFIRVLEACNADCFMCRFRLSKDRYRFPAYALERLLPRVYEEGIRYVRFTGGEPLLHTEIVRMVAITLQAGMLSSIITNGSLLAKKMDDLAAAGLGQVIVSIDGSNAQTHDEIRGTPGLFDRAITGLRAAQGHGIHCRVNTVCGPRNFREMPALQDLLTQLGVKQWELSSLKLERPLDYTPQDRIDAEAIVEYIYHDTTRPERLIPMGKVWCGDTLLERERYFSTGIPPRADGACLTVHKVRYLDAKNDMLYPCSLLPHRPAAPGYASSILSPESFSVLGPQVQQQADYFQHHGPSICTGCSTTAAGFSNQLLLNASTEAWAY